MEFTVEEVIDVGNGKVEVRARLTADQRLVCITLPVGTDSDYQAAVQAYLTEFQTPVINGG